jgi:hypothetical protein
MDTGREVRWQQRDVERIGSTMIVGLTGQTRR